MMLYGVAIVQQGPDCEILVRFFPCLNLGAIFSLSAASSRTPAAILGIDLWAQGRLMVLGAADHSHARTLFWKRG
jgi:hypothetical protein